jgi:hypothetical protein
MKSDGCHPVFDSTGWRAEELVEVNDGRPEECQRALSRGTSLGGLAPHAIILIALKLQQHLASRKIHLERPRLLGAHQTTVILARRVYNKEDDRCAL